MSRKKGGYYYKKNAYNKYNSFPTYKKKRTYNNDNYYYSSSSVSNAEVAEAFSGFVLFFIVVCMILFVGYALYCSASNSTRPVNNTVLERARSVSVPNDLSETGRTRYTVPPYTFVYNNHHNNNDRARSVSFYWQQHQHIQQHLQQKQQQQQQQQQQRPREPSTFVATLWPTDVTRRDGRSLSASISDFVRRAASLATGNNNYNYSFVTFDGMTNERSRVWIAQQVANQNGPASLVERESINALNLAFGKRKADQSREALLRLLPSWLDRIASDAIYSTYQGAQLSRSTTISEETFQNAIVAALSKRFPGIIGVFVEQKKDTGVGFIDVAFSVVHEDFPNFQNVIVLQSKWVPATSVFVGARACLHEATRYAKSMECGVLSPIKPISCCLVSLGVDRENVLSTGGAARGSHFVRCIDGDELPLLNPVAMGGNNNNRYSFITREATRRYIPNRQQIQHQSRDAMLHLLPDWLDKIASDAIHRMYSDAQNNLGDDQNYFTEDIFQSAIVAALRNPFRGIIGVFVEQEKKTTTGRGFIDVAFSAVQEKFPNFQNVVVLELKWARETSVAAGQPHRFVSVRKSFATSSSRASGQQSPHWYPCAPRDEEERISWDELGERALNQATQYANDMKCGVLTQIKPISCCLVGFGVERENVLRTGGAMRGPHFVRCIGQ